MAIGLMSFSPNSVSLNSSNALQSPENDQHVVVCFRICVQEDGHLVCGPWECYGVLPEVVIGAE